VIWRVAVILVGVGFVAHRLALWLEIRKARRAGDSRRVDHLRQHGFGLYRWAVLCLVAFMVVLVFLVWANSR
jgi:hypothetical protein